MERDNTDNKTIRREVGCKMQLNYVVDGEDFLRAGEASAAVKRTLKQLGIDSQLVRKVAIAMYEAEMNMVLHAYGGTIVVNISPVQIDIVLRDQGPGIENIEQAMQAGYSTATHKIRELGFGAGMGLPNMKRYSDALKIESTLGVGTIVKLCFSLQ